MSNLHFLGGRQGFQVARFSAGAVYSANICDSRGVENVGRWALFRTQTHRVAWAANSLINLKSPIYRKFLFVFFKLKKN